MENLLASYEKKYGIVEKYVLADLGGNINDIIAEYASVPAYPFSSMVDDVFTDADNIHNMVARDIQIRYFNQITREQAVTICNLLNSGDGYGTIKISSRLDLEYNAYTFMAAWNEIHQESEKICAPATFEI